MNTAAHQPVLSIAMFFHWKTLVHGYANPLTIRRFVKLVESPKVLKMLPLVVSVQHVPR